MFKLSYIILALMLSFNAYADKSPHGVKFSIKCDVCHNPEGWAFKTKGNAFDHSLTGFPLAGQHQAVDCRKCHVDLVFSNAKTTCISCHKDMHQQTVGQDCERCHTPRTWVVTNITEVHRKTRFPLNGQHAQIDCYQCHKSASLLRFEPMGAECADCHSATFSATTNPSHVVSKFPKDCFLCHDEKGWQPAKFNHNTNTAFPLTGSHIGVDCFSCHSGGYVGTSTDCASCHTKNYDATTAPVHAAAKFSKDCITCHTTASWTSSNFNHNTSTTFPLTGGHNGITCISCHSKGYAGTSPECVGCHLTNYNATTNPSHVTAKYSTTCKTCHSSAAWVPSTFNHNTNTAFPLTGNHIGVSCISCHANGYAGTLTDCVSCHLANYNATTNPSHVTAKYSTDCKMCHTSAGWSPSSFNHNTSTAFPLTGSHIGVACISCHSKGYTGTSTLCESCHIANYNATTNPSHTVVKFPTDCKTCHNSTAWQPSTFNHNTNTTFPIIGAHIGVSCISCHSKGYAGTSTDCFSCHAAKYNATTNPAHAGAKFPTTCLSCHTQNGWTPATFNHDTQYFPINSGNHKGKWTLCSECHTNPSNYAVFSCLLCHEHNKASMDSEHRGRNGYVYNSTNCLSCHPRGNS